MNTPLPPAYLAPASPTALEAPTADEIAAALDALAGQLTGETRTPAHPDWDAARTAWNLAVDQRPAAVVLAADARDVALTVHAAAELGLRVAPQSTGHNASPMGDLADTLLLRTSAMRGVEIDPAARVARVEGGAQWGDVTSAVAPHGLTALAGSAADVGVVGYLLGGGVSWFTRSHGLAVNSVLAIELVTADGRLRRIDDDHEPELFWAVRGGGGNFGVVTAVELRLFPIAEAIAGALFFPLERAAEVLHAWREWTATVPESVTSVGRLLRFPPLPELPPFLRGQSFAVVEAVIQEDAATADALLAPLRALGAAIDTVHPTPTAELDRLHMDPPAPVPGIGNGVQLRELSVETLDALLAATGPGTDTALLSVELRHLGGAAARSPRHGGVVARLDGEFLAFGVGIAAGPEVGTAVVGSIERMLEALSPWAAGIRYQNFAESAVPARAIWGDDLPRLRAIKSVVDPADRIRANHPLR